MNTKKLIMSVLMLTVLSVSAQVRELPLPAVPDSITVSAERADFVMLHFWDTMDFSDSSLTDDNDFLEQNFVNYLSLFPHANKDNLQLSVNHFLDMAAVHENIYTMIYDLAGTYLNNSDSPMRNEGYYILFLNHAVDGGRLGEADRERAKFRLEMAMKNRPGVPAPDFRVVSRNGEECDFSDLLKEGDNIVIFYDPDCSHCGEVITEISSNSSLQKNNIIAIDSEEDRQLWEETNAILPDSWAVAFSLDPIQDDELYIFPEMPTMYLIDGDRTIKIKEATLDNIVNCLQ